MRFMRTTILAGGAALLVAGTAAAAADRSRTMEVPLPDGGTVHVEYAGEVAPRVTVARALPRYRVMALNPFAQLDRIAWEMRARHEAMMRQMAALEQQARAQAVMSGPGRLTVVGDVPTGVRYSYYSSTTDASGCTRTVQYSLDGSGAEPQVTRASAGSCEAAPGEAGPVPAAGVEAEPKTRQLDDFDV